MLHSAHSVTHACSPTFLPVMAQAAIAEAEGACRYRQPDRGAQVPAVVLDL